MTKKPSIFLANAIHAQGPWHLKRGNTDNNPTYTLVDFYGNPIARLCIPENPDRSYTPDQFRATQNLLLRAPKLLAALMEYAYNMDMQTGSISQELRDLIVECGGRDLQSRVRPDDTES